MTIHQGTKAPGTKALGTKSLKYRMTNRERAQFSEKLLQLDVGFEASPAERRSGWLVVCRAMEHLAGRHGVVVATYEGNQDVDLTADILAYADYIYRLIQGGDPSADTQIAMFITVTHQLAVDRLNTL